MELCGAKTRFTHAGGAGSSGSGLPVWEKGPASRDPAALWGAGSPGDECGAGAGSAVLGSPTTPGEPGASPVPPLVLCMLVPTQRVPRPPFSPGTEWVWPLQGSLPAALGSSRSRGSSPRSSPGPQTTPGWGRGTGSCPTPTSLQPPSKVRGTGRREACASALLLLACSRSLALP